MLALTPLTREVAISETRLIPEDMKRFSQLGEIAEFIESLNIGINGDTIVGFLLPELFSGTFDPKDTKAVPARYAQSKFFENQTMALPRIPSSGNCAVSRYVYGSSRMLIPLLHKLEALPLEAPEKLSNQFINEACSKLAELSINQFSETARDVLDCVMVEKTILRRWFEAVGLMTPRENKAGQDAQSSAANCNAPVQLSLVKSREEKAKPGRPASELWSRVQELVTELHKINPETYNNAMASEIHERLLVEFPDRKVLALTTIQGNMMSLREKARIELGL